MITLSCEINKVPVTVILDSGANCNVIGGGVVNEVGLKIDDISDTKIHNPISVFDVLGVIHEIEISILSQGPKWKHVKITDNFVSNEPQLEFVLLLGQPWFQENAMKLDIPNKTLTLLDGTNIPLVIVRENTPPTQGNESVDNYFEMIKVYATVLGIDLDNQDLKGTFFNGLSLDNKKEAIRFGVKKSLNEMVEHLNRISSRFTDIEKFPFGSLEQGNDSIMDFYRKVKKYYKLLGNVEELYLKNHFIRGLSRDNQLEAGRCGLDLPLDELVARLSALENLTNQDK
ncbi:hypothetical protein Glove_73g14 [Diversispora epigaea]|uniref:Uncharacterized protein n=1 Tax=Diversispora epigaea TaxID=1348612 RepID=A0A397JD32_9GLOM|nr:hypothetical protein Glove_73g19 [Diversispora epigaea]RHZ85050.1 hypothetical protein Glove_73g14 [Diversispora epigaea]